MKFDDTDAPLSLDYQIKAAQRNRARHHFFQISHDKRVIQIPANTLHDNIDGIMQASERFLDQKNEQITS